MTTNIYSEIVNILEECVQGGKSLETSLACIWRYEGCKDDFIKEVLHFFRHYYDDVDIRNKDLEYAEFQNQKLRKYIALLKEKSQDETSDKINGPNPGSD
ncbi:MAG: hypothetical protein WAU17_19505 [Nitrospirales bacterium]